MSFDKGLLVNWMKFYDPDHVKEAQTIEFRQHASTADPEVIKRWALFVLGLVKTAYRLAAKEPSVTLGERWEREGVKYPRNSFRGTGTRSVDLEELLTLMDLDTTEEAYWRSRFQLYKDRDLTEEKNHKRRRTVWEAEHPEKKLRAEGKPIVGEIINSADEKTRSNRYGMSAPVLKPSPNNYDEDALEKWEYAGIFEPEYVETDDGAEDGEENEEENGKEEAEDEGEEEKQSRKEDEEETGDDEDIELEDESSGENATEEDLETNTNVAGEEEREVVPETRMNGPFRTSRW
jgi:hypothetical protein